MAKNMAALFMLVFVALSVGSIYAYNSSGHSQVSWSIKFVILPTKKSYTIPNLKWSFISIITMRPFVIIA